MLKSALVLGSILASVLLSACVTSQERTDQEEAAARIVATNCITRVSIGSYNRPDKKIDLSGVYIAGMSKGENDWVQIYAIMNEVDDNIYYNTNSKKVVCGAKTWSDLGLVFHVAPGKVNLSGEKR